MIYTDIVLFFHTKTVACNTRGVYIYHIINTDSVLGGEDERQYESRKSAFKPVA